MISYSLTDAVNILSRTPDVIKTLSDQLPGPWISNNEGEGTWSPFDVVGHLIEGEKTDWMPRARKILDPDDDKHFESFDRFAQEEESKGKTYVQLLQEFSDYRQKNIEELRSMNIREEDMDKTGIHPEFGEVTLRQLLATWVAHDLTHISQIVRVMAKQYKQEIGPWIKYLSRLS